MAILAPAERPKCDHSYPVFEEKDLLRPQIIQRCVGCNQIQSIKPVVEGWVIRPKPIKRWPSRVKCSNPLHSTKIYEKVVYKNGGHHIAQKCGVCFKRIRLVTKDEASKVQW